MRYCKKYLPCLLVGVILLSSSPLHAQFTPNTPEVKKLYHVLDSLWNDDKYDSVVSYGRSIESIFKQHNTFPTYPWFDLLVDYIGASLIETGHYDEAERVLLEIKPTIKSTASTISNYYSDVNYELGKLYMQTGRYSKAYAYFQDAMGSGEVLKNLSR